MDSNGISLSCVRLAFDFASGASGRIYAAYGGIYIFSALMWLRFVDQISLSRWDLLGESWSF